MKKYMVYLTAAVCLILAACNNTVEPSTNTGDDSSDFVENQTWNETVTITYDGTAATIGDLPDGVTVKNENGYVTVTSTVKHIAYEVSGSGSGQLNFYSDYKFSLTLSNLSLSCSDGPAVNNQCGKSLYLILEGDNTLSDGSTYTESDEDRKAALFSEGQVIVSGTGSLAMTGNYKQAFASDDYIRIRSGELDLADNGSDGIHTNEGVIINGGTVSILAANDGIQCDTSSIVVTGGTVNITSAGDKGLLAYGNIEISGGNITVKSTGKGIKTKSNLIVSDGVISVTASSPVSYLAPAWGGGPGGPGGTGGGPGGDMGGGGGPGNESSGPEGIEAKGTITISGGQIYACAEDDAINSGSDMTITGGYVCGYSTGNDGLDANGNCYIKGGIVYAIGSGSPEVGIDANTEQRKQLYITGGTVVAIGGLENGASVSIKSTSSQWSSNTWYALYSGNDLAFAFLTPSSGGNTLTVCTSSSPSLTSGITVSSGTAIFNGMGNINGTISK